MSLLVALLIIIIIILVWKISIPYISQDIYERYDYFDYAATTPPYEESLMYAYNASYQGNLSQSYNSGNRECVDRIKEDIIGLIGCRDVENFRLIWTSGASEANNTVIKTFSLFANSKNTIIMNNTEHHTSLSCIRDPINWPFTKGNPGFILYDFRYPEELGKIITKDTKLISVMHVNNEIGYIYPIDRIYAIIEEYRKNNNTIFPFLHVDMSQSLGKSLQLNCIPDIITASAHKFYGPLGSGFIISRKDIPIQTQIYGTQQDNLRGGTVNFPAIVATYNSLKKSLSEEQKKIKNITEYRNIIFNALAENFPVVNIFDLQDVEPKGITIGIYPNSSPYILSFSVLVPKGKFNNIDFKKKLLEKKIIIGTGSACSVGSSEVLNNLNLPMEANQGFIRLSFGRLTNYNSVIRLKKALISEIKKAISNL